MNETGSNMDGGQVTSFYWLHVNRTSTNASTSFVNNVNLIAVFITVPHHVFFQPLVYTSTLVGHPSPKQYVPKA
jgi:hypothetical protein